MFCKILKLTNGDTVIANIVEETKGYVEVHRPMRVIVSPKTSLEDHMYQLSMMKWDPLLNFSVPARIFKQSIVSVAEATNDVFKVYVELYDQFEAGSQQDNIELNETETNEQFDSEEEKKLDEKIKELLTVLTANNQTFH
jgi:hypothetical protein